MSTNKHAQIRYNTLDKCFRNPGRNYTITNLIEECNKAIIDFDPNADGIKKRQLYEDIRYMKSEQGWGIELNDDLKLGRKKIYRYLDINFSISKQGLNEADTIQLKTTLATLSRFDFDWIEELILRLEDQFKIKSDSKKIIQFEENPYLEGKDYITQLYNAIHYKKTLEISYLSFKSKEPSVIIIYPYFLKQYNNRWFLFGQNKGYKNLTNLALDRIENVKETNQEYIESNIDFDEYFEDVIGVTISDSPVEKIILKVTNEAINYIITKPLHGSQIIKQRQNDFTIVELELIPNYELESLLLSFGENIEVIEPFNLRNGLKERVKKIYKNYQD